MLVPQGTRRHSPSFPVIANRGALNSLNADHTSGFVSVPVVMGTGSGLRNASGGTLGVPPLTGWKVYKNGASQTINTTTFSNSTIGGEALFAVLLTITPFLITDVIAMSYKEDPYVATNLTFDNLGQPLNATGGPISVVVV